MKSTKETLIIIIALLLSIKCYAQSSEFSTPEGFKWGMTRNTVLKLNSSQPKESTTELIYYLNKQTLHSLLYQFLDNKLTSITKKYEYDTEDDLTLDFDKYTKQFINLYGASYTKIAYETFQWTYKNTEIMLFSNYDKNRMRIFIRYKKI